MTPEVAEVVTFLKGGAGSGDELTAAEDVGGCLDPHVEADSVSYPETTNCVRLKWVRKAESMGTAVPEEKMQAEGVLLGESAAGPSNETAATPRPSNWATMTKS